MNAACVVNPYPTIDQSVLDAKMTFCRHSVKQARVSVFLRNDRRVQRVPNEQGASDWQLPVKSEQCT